MNNWRLITFHFEPEPRFIITGFAQVKASARFLVEEGWILYFFTHEGRPADISS
ncbi:MAG: hypothetical protein ACUVWV_06935 [Thermodesulfobacteriota bacterium]